jgi:hypothetical protein
MSTKKKRGKITTILCRICNNALKLAEEENAFDAALVESYALKRSAAECTEEEDSLEAAVYESKTLPLGVDTDDHQELQRACALSLNNTATVDHMTLNSAEEDELALALAESLQTYKDQLENAGSVNTEVQEIERPLAVSMFPCAEFDEPESPLSEDWDLITYQEGSNNNTSIPEHWTAVD